MKATSFIAGLRPRTLANGLFSALVILTTLGPALAQSKKQIYDVNPLLGKDFPAYEKVLGPAKKIDRFTDFKTDNEKKVPGETRYYKSKDKSCIRIILYKGSDGEYGEVFNGVVKWKKRPSKLDRNVTSISFEFQNRADITWEVAAGLVGIASSSVTDVRKFQDGVSCVMKYKTYSLNWYDGGHTLTINVH